MIDRPTRAPELRGRAQPIAEIRRPAECRRLGLDRAGVVHLPYTDHVVVRRTSGVRNLLASDPEICTDCFPPPPKRATTRRSNRVFVERQLAEAKRIAASTSESR